MAELVPVVTIDGPSGTGKGTMCQLLAQDLGWHMLDSGALYRVLALAADKHHIALDDEPALAVLAGKLDVQFTVGADQVTQSILLEGVDVSQAIRQPACGSAASQVSVHPQVRGALLQRQRDFRVAPGLVTDGRDMGTVVFPDASLKVFMDASAEERAKRRTLQLQKKGEVADFEDILAQIKARDLRDRTRTVAPLVPAEDAEVVDTTGLSIEQVFDRIRGLVQERLGQE
jgi:CMP/dCMP kinase